MGAGLRLARAHREKIRRILPEDCALQGSALQIWNVPKQWLQICFLITATALLGAFLLRRVLEPRPLTFLFAFRLFAVFGILHPRDLRRDVDGVSTSLQLAQRFRLHYRLEAEARAHLNVRHPVRAELVEEPPEDGQGVKLLRHQLVLVAVPGRVEHARRRHYGAWLIDVNFHWRRRRRRHLALALPLLIDVNFHVLLWITFHIEEVRTRHGLFVS